MGYMTEKLQRCKCGADAELNGSHGGTIWYAKCTGCGKRGKRFEGKEREAQKEAIAWWNKEIAK